MRQNKERNVPVKIGDEEQIIFTGLTDAGEGVGRVQGFAVFVPFAVPGDKGKVKITEVKKNFARGELLELLEEGEGRIEPPCPVYGYCGGCQLQHVDYSRQLELKTGLVKDAITRIGGLSPELVREIIGARKIWHYRNRGQFPVGGKDKSQIGYFMARSREIVPIDSCPIQQGEINKLIGAAKQFVAELKDDNLKHLVFKVSPNTGQTMAILVTKNSHFPQGKKFAQFLKSQVPNLNSVIHNFNPKPYGPVLGRESRLLLGEQVLQDEISDLSFEVSAESFTQVNPEQTKVLYDQALIAAALTGEETVIDAYCGIGTISLALARQAKLVYGIEVVPEAVEDAKKNAERNGINNARFMAGKVEEILPRLAREGVKPEVIVVDPPRKGCEKNVLSAMAQMSPERIVYVSCNPVTLARDLKILAGEGYQPQYVQPVDMFPQVADVETVTLLTRNIETVEYIIL